MGEQALEPRPRKQGRRPLTRSTFGHCSLRERRHWDAELPITPRVLQARDPPLTRARGGLKPRRTSGWMHCVSTDTRLGVATTLGSEVTAMCVQLVDASGNLAIHMPTRILLRSSSTHEPSDPPLEVVSLSSLSTSSQPAHTSTRARRRSEAPPQALE